MAETFHNPLFLLALDFVTHASSLSFKYITIIHIALIVYGSFAVLSDPAKRLDYDITGNYEINKYTLPVRTSILSSGSFCHPLWLLSHSNLVFELFCDGC